MLNNEKFILIDILSRFQMPVNKLIYVSKIGSYVAMEFEPYDIATMERLIFEMLNEKLCFIEHFNSYETIDISHSAIAFYQNESRFDFAINDNIGLTAYGGALWEKQYLPRWENFIDCSYDNNSFIHPMSLEMNCQNLALLKQVTDPLLLENFEKYIQISDNFQPCYWKRLEGKTYHFAFTPTTLHEKIITETIFENLHQYSYLFSPSKNFF